MGLMEFNKFLSEAADVISDIRVLKAELDRHSHCSKMLENAKAKVECFQTIAFPMKAGGVWEVNIYYFKDGEPKEWFGTACCADRAIAMALNDFVE